MTQTTIDVQTPRGMMPVHVHEPGDGSAAPLVVLLMDAPGVRPALHQHAERLVAAGYRVAIPDLYYAMDPADKPDVERLAAGDPDEFARMGAAIAQIKEDEVIADLELMLAELNPTPQWGAVGFCFGGRLALRAAQRFGDQLAAASLLHPSRLVSDEPNSPHTNVDHVRASLFLGFGEKDHVTPLSVIPPVEEQLQQHGIEHRIEVIPGADHGFTMPGMPAYDPTAAEQAWAGTMALLGEHLGA